MRNFFLIQFLIVPFLLFSQIEKKDGNYNYKIFYQLHYQPDSTNSEKIETEQMVLYVGDGFSRFSSVGVAMNDSLLIATDRSDNLSFGEISQLRSQIPPYKFEYYVYKNFTKEKLYFTRNLAKKNYRYKEKLDKLNWNISSETNELFGYKAQKATTSYAGRDYIAWFTTEIPISDGPYKFQGLPGLIIKLSDTENQYVFSLNEIKKLQKPKEIRYSKINFITTTKEKVEKVKKEYNKDPISYVEKSTGISFDFKDGDRERMKQQHLKKERQRNNPIELE